MAKPGKIVVDVTGTEIFKLTAEALRAAFKLIEVLEAGKEIEYVSAEICDNYYRAKENLEDFTPQKDG